MKERVEQVLERTSKLIIEIENDVSEYSEHSTLDSISNLVLSYCSLLDTYHAIYCSEKQSVNEMEKLADSLVDGIKECL